MQKPVLFLALFLWVGAVFAEQPKPLYKLSKTEQLERIKADLQSIRIYRQGLEKATTLALQQTNFFTTVSPAITALPHRDAKEILWQTWKSYLDYIVALDAIEHYHADFFKLRGERHDGAFLVSYAAFIAKYHTALQLIDASKKNASLDIILNEPVPELGLPAGTFANLKFHYLNATTAAEFDVSRGLYETVKKELAGDLRPAIEADAAFLVKMGFGKGQVLAVKNGLKILRTAAATAWLPVQAGVSEWMGDTKVYRRNRCLITEEQLHQLAPRLLPGDVLLIRHEWYLSNVGLPGFWPHAAIYIGTPEQRSKYFGDADLQVWVRSQKVSTGNFEDLLRTNSAAAYELSLQPDTKKHLPRVMEAISEGVSLSALEHAADADSVVVLRPLVSKKEKAIALLRTFHYQGRPYDFNFDFTTDAQLVCSELVFKAYEPAEGMKGLHLPLVEMLGRPLLPPNEIAHQFDTDYDKGNAQFEFVAFLDGYEKEGKAKESTLEAFRQSWKRPKWHVLVQ